MLDRSSSPSNKLRLHTVLVVPFVLQIVAAVGLVGYFSFRSGQQAVNNLANRLMEEIGLRIDREVSDYLAVPQRVQQMNLRAIKAGEIDIRDFDRLGKIFWNQAQSFGFIYLGLATVNKEYIGAGYFEGKPNVSMLAKPRLDDFWAYEPDELGNPKSQPVYYEGEGANYFETEPWYRETVAAGKSIWGSLYNWQDAPEEIAMSFGSPIFNGAGKLEGTIGIDVSLSQLNTFLRSLQIGKTGEAFIIERSGKLVATSSSKPSYKVVNAQAQQLQAIESPEPLIQSAATYLIEEGTGLESIQTPQRFSYIYKGERNFLFVTPYKDEYGLDWLIAIAVPESDFTEQINQNIRNTIWLCLAALGIAIAIGAATARWITHPIQRVSQAAEDLAKGDLDQQVDASRIAEIDRLANSFNGMARQLNNSFTSLEESEAKNRALLDAIPDLILKINRDGIYLDVIEGEGVAILTTGSGKLDHLDRHVQDVLPAELAQQYLHAIHQALQTGEIQKLEYRLTANGRIGDYEARVVQSGNNEAIFIVRDITDRNQAEEALRQSERQNRALVSSIPDLLICMKGDGTYLSAVSSNRLSIVNSELSNAGDTHIYDILPQPIADLRMRYVRQALETNIMQVYQQTIEIDGKLQHEEVRIVVIHEDEVLVIVRDITDRQQAEEALRIAEENYRGIFENALEGIFQSVPEGKFISVNPAMARIYGYDSPEDMMIHITNIGEQLYVHASERDEFRRLMREQGYVRDFEYQSYRKDKSITWIQIGARVVRDDGGQVLYYEGIVQDITDQKQQKEILESMVAERTTDLAEANKEISNLNEKLQSENLRMGAELSVVRRLQQMILPKDEELNQIAELDIAGFMQSADEVGGDYYDVLRHNGLVKIGIGDVTGHGLESGMLMLMTQTAVRTLLEYQEADSRQFFNAVNRVIYENANRMNCSKSLTLSLLDYRNGYINVSGYHEDVIVVRSNGEVERIDTVMLGLPIGLEADITSFIAEAQVQLHTDDVVVLYTDGITEAKNDLKQQYGIDRLCHLVSQYREYSANQIRQAVIDDVQHHLGGQPIQDDLTLLILKQR